MIGVGWALGPYVAHIFLKIPKEARRSKETLMNYVKRLGPNQQMDIVYTQFTGFRKTTGVQLKELRALPSKRGVSANMARMSFDSKGNPIKDEQPFWRTGPRTKFYVQDTDLVNRKSAAPGIWKLVWQRIQQQSVPVSPKQQSGQYRQWIEQKQQSVP